MRLFLCLLAVVFSTYHSNAEVFKRSGEVKVVVVDHFGKAISNAAVSVENHSTHLTDEKGEVIVPEIEWKTSYQIRTLAEKYQEHSNFYSFDKKNNFVRIELGWTKPIWDELIEEFREKEMHIRDSVYKALNFSDSTNCSDVSQSQHWLNASFPGGMKILELYLKDMTKYPETSMTMGEHGKVYLTFVVDSTGGLTEIKIMRGVSQEIDREAKRLIEEMPVWIPASCNGKNVNVRCNLPIIFTLT